jgi:hypothetical protein
LSAAPLASGVVFADGSRPAAHLSVLYDHRHEAARAFRLRAARWDAPIAGTLDGDITELWQNYYRVVWQKKPAALAGLTERPALFLLEQLGWQHGMRVFFQAAHEPAGDGIWRHRILRSSRPGLAGHLEAAGMAWPAALADQLVTAPQDVASKDMTPTGAAMAAFLNEPDKLYSWIIAPKSVVEHI